MTSTDVSRHHPVSPGGRISPDETHRDKGVHNPPQETLHSMTM